MENQQERKEYQEPQLIEHGGIRDITQNGGNGTGDVYSGGLA